MTQFGLAVPQTLTSEIFDVGAVTEIAKRAEDLGYHSLWVGDGLATAAMLEAWTLLSFTAACTSSIRLGTSVLVLPWRNPVLVAQAAATLDHLTGGRVILGVGIGDRRPADAAFDVAPDAARHRPALFEEQVRLIRRCWEDGPVRWEGEAWDFPEMAVEPKPVQRLGPPIWIGADGPAALERAARLGDGWMGRGSSTNEAFTRSANVLRGHLDEAGRTETGFALSKRVFAFVVTDGRIDSVMARLGDWSAAVYGDAELVPRCAIVGDPDTCVAGLKPLVEQRLDLVLLDPIFDIAEQARRFRRDVLPAWG